MVYNCIMLVFALNYTCHSFEALMWIIYILQCTFSDMIIFYRVIELLYACFYVWCSIPIVVSVRLWQTAPMQPHWALCQNILRATDSAICRVWPKQRRSWMKADLNSFPHSHSDLFNISRESKYYGALHKIELIDDCLPNILFN
jgi:hypothetical protein